MRHIIIFALLCCLLLTACSQKPTAPTELPTDPPVTLGPTQAPTEAQMQTFTLYHGDANAEFFLSEQVQVPEITENVVVEQLISAGVLKAGVAVNSISMDGTQLILDFNQDFADLVCSMGTSGEYIIIGSTVNTFLSAFHAESLLFTVNGEVLESGHVIYDFPLEFME